MSPRRNAQVAFASAVGVLLLSAIAAYVIIGRLQASQAWVVHTYQVQAALGEVDVAVSRAARARNSYVTTGNPSLLVSFNEAIPEIEQKLRSVKMLTADSPKQQQLSADLEDATARRIALFRSAIALKQDSPGDAAGQADIAGKDLALSFERASIMQEMRDQEQRLLMLRTATSNRFFSLTVITLAISFALALLLFSIHYRLLSAELEARAQAEHAARDSEASLRYLTSRLLQLQDEERRKFSRELHDSLGQYLAGVKMNLEMFSRRHSDSEVVAAIELLDQSIAETRTISHLLHPPLLDEVGFSSAAKWYVEGFSERSGVQVKLDMPDNLGRLPRDFELALFRVLQESLTNMHRHSKSGRAEVTLRSSASAVNLLVKDYGNGIPEELLANFRSGGPILGVGLSGMRERVRELNGHVDIQSNSSGTLISVDLPLDAKPPHPSSAPQAELRLQEE